jgi:hypothetical protein
VVPKVVFDSTLGGNVVSRYWKGVFLIPIPSESDRIECERSFIFLHFPAFSCKHPPFVASTWEKTCGA